MILGILGGLSLLGVSFLGFSLGAVGGSSALQIFSLAIPILAFVGAGVVMKNGVFGGILMLTSAAGVLLTIGMNVFGIFFSMLLIIAGALGVMSAQGKKTTAANPIRRQEPVLPVPRSATESISTGIDTQPPPTSENKAAPQTPIFSTAVARAQEYCQNAFAKAQEYYAQNRPRVKARYQDALRKAEALAAKQSKRSVEIPRKPTPTPNVDAAETRNRALPLAGVVIASLLGYFGLNLYDNKQELERMQRTAQQEAAARRAAEQQAEAERQARQQAAAREAEAQRRAQQEAEARRVAEQQAEVERQALQETAAREAEAQRRAQQEAEARRIAQERAEAEKRARQEATAREAEARRIAQQEAEARRKAQAAETQNIARDQATAERKANLEIEAQTQYQNALAQAEKKYQYAQEQAKKRYDYALARANGRFEWMASAEKTYHDSLAKAQKYYVDNRAKAEARYQDSLAKITKAYGQN